MSHKIDSAYKFLKFDFELFWFKSEVKRLAANTKARNVPEKTNFNH